MKIKALLSKKVATIALAGTIGLGAVGTATYAAAPGLIDKIVSNFIYYAERDMNDYKSELTNSIPGKVATAVSDAQASFNTYYNTKKDESKKKVLADVDKYVKDQSTITTEERADAEARIKQKFDKKSEEITAQLKAKVDEEFKK